MRIVATVVFSCLPAVVALGPSGCSPPVYWDLWSKTTEPIQVDLREGEPRLYSIRVAAEGDPQFDANGHVDLEFLRKIPRRGGGHEDATIAPGRHVEAAVDCDAEQTRTEVWTSNDASQDDTLATVVLGESLPFELECELAFTLRADAPTRDSSRMTAFWWTAQVNVFSQPLDTFRLSIEER